MKLRVLSDLHFEFHPDGGRHFLRSLPRVDHDVAIVAGDLCMFRQIGESLRMLGDTFERVVYVIGNHEAYGVTIQQALDAAEEAASGIENLNVLEQDTVTIGTARIHGASLWFPYDGPATGEEMMNDFWQIQGLRGDVDRWNRGAVNFLEDSAREGDIVVTHHLPHVASVHEKYSASALNAFFVGGAGHVVKDNAPALWIHGHTHESLDYHLERTRVVCNPHGYWPSDVNPQFNPALVVEVNGTDT